MGSCAVLERHLWSQTEVLLPSKVQTLGWFPEPQKVFGARMKGREDAGSSKSGGERRGTPHSWLTLFLWVSRKQRVT